MSKLFQQNLNWLIVSHIEDSLLKETENCLKDVSEEDWSTYTSAKGINSKQNYIINPKWMPSENHKEPKGWKEVKTNFENFVQKEIVFYGLLPPNWNKIYANSAWTVTGGEGSYHSIHDHGASNISSVVYLEVPNNDEELNLPSGSLFFVLDANGYTNLSVPNYRTVHIKPKKGMIVIFPSWLLHGVYPQEKGVRRTLNIDFSDSMEYKMDTPCSGSLFIG